MNAMEARVEVFEIQRRFKLKNDELVLDTLKELKRLEDEMKATSDGASLLSIEISALRLDVMDRLHIDVKYQGETAAWVIETLEEIIKMAREAQSGIDPLSM